MMFSTMMPLLVVISLLQPVAHHSILVPILLGKIIALKHALIIVPKIAIGAVLFGQGAAVIGGDFLWRYLQWRRHHRPYYYRHGKRYRAHPYPFPAFGGWGGWGKSASIAPLLHEKYNAAYYKGHRAIDYLALGLDKARDAIAWKSAKAAHLAAELVKPLPYGWGYPAYGKPYSYGHAPVKVIEEVSHGPVVEVSSDPAEYAEAGPVSEGHVYESDGGYGAPSSSSHSVESGSGPYYSSAAEAGHTITSSESDNGDGTSGYATNPSGYGGESYEGHGSESSPYYKSGSSSGKFYGEESRSVYSSAEARSMKTDDKVPKIFKSGEPLNRDEFMKLMEWAASGESEYRRDELNHPLKRSTGTEAVNPEEVEPRNSNRIKRKVDTTKEKEKITKFLVDDVRRFFSIVAYLDENKCLQKLVCDVHTKAKSSTATTMKGLSVYESHIIGAFRILDTFMPPYETDSSTNYRVAAQLGLRSPSGEICSYYYDSCKYSTEDIIGYSDKIESNQLEKVKDQMIMEQGVDKETATTIISPLAGISAAMAEVTLPKV